MRKLSILLVLVLLGSLVSLSIPVKAESNSSYWVKTYGGSHSDYAYAVAIAENGDVIVAGSTYSFGAGGKDVWVLRIDAQGNVKWQKTYGGSWDDWATAVAIAPNGDIIVAGYTRSFGASGKDAWVLRLDGQGNVKWQKTYGGSWDDWATAVAVAENGDIIVAGYTRSFGASGKDAWVLRLDGQGNVKWQKTYGGSWDDWATAVAVAENGDIIVAGYTESFGASTGVWPDVWVLCLDANGNVKWQKTYGGSNDDVASAVAVAENGDVIVAGYTRSFGAGKKDVWVLRLDANGNVKWQKTYGGKYGDDATAVAIADNGDIIVAGPTLSFGAGDEDVWVLRLDANGNVKWQKTHGGSSIDEAHAVTIAENGDIIVAGWTGSFGAGDWEDVWVLRLPKDGNLLGCNFCENSKARVTYTSAEVSAPNAGVEESDAEIHNTNAEVHYTNAEVETLWATGTLEVTSDPSGAKVYVNGSYKGETPLTLELSPGNYTIKITKKDYENYTTTVTLGMEETKNVSVTLVPLFGYLNVTSSPSGAKVYVDGDYVGTTPLEDYKLSPGEHTVRIKKEGYEEYTKTVTVEAGKSVSVSAGLVAVQSGGDSGSTYTPTEQNYPEESGRTSGGLNPAYLIAVLIGLIAVGGIAVKAKGGKPKPSPSPGDKAKPSPAPTKKPELRTPPKPVPGFPPELLNKYEPLEFLGEGGFAKVFKVRRKSDGKIIALKVSRLDEKAKKFFMKEVKAWRLLNHKNIVKLYNAFDEPLPHLEIEFIDGIKLNDEVIRDLGKYPKPVDEKKALHFIRGIAEGLKHAHGKQVYHRDLKPQNILITSDLTPKITDWGLAKVGAVSTTATTTKGLTLLYAAPEQLDDETYGHTDQRTDIYQLGLIFYELLTGKLPYQGTSPAVVMAKVINPAVKPKPPSHYNKALAKYDGIFEKLLAKEKEQRYQSVEEFLRDLELMKKLDEERKALEKEIEKTKTTMSVTTDSKELKKLMRQLVGQLSRNALLHAQLNDKAGLINALEDLKAFSKEHRVELENAISQFELMMRESVPISKSTLDELRVLLHNVQREVE